MNTHHGLTYEHLRDDVRALVFSSLAAAPEGKPTHEAYREFGRELHRLAGSDAPEDRRDYRQVAQGAAAFRAATGSEFRHRPVVLDDLPDVSEALRFVAAIRAEGARGRPLCGLPPYAQSLAEWLRWVGLLRMEFRAGVGVVAVAAGKAGDR